MPSHGSLRLSAGVPGRRLSPPSPAWSPRRTSSAPWASCIPTAGPRVGAAFTQISGYSFLVFNLLCAPCFAAIGAIKREMNNAKWTWFAIGYQCGFAYLVALMINQFGNAFTGSLNVLGLIAAVAALALIVYMLFKPYKEATKLSAKV